MNQLGFPVISLVTFFPIFGVLILMFIDKKAEDTLRGTAMVFALIEFFISLPLLFSFQNGVAGMQFVERYSWLKSLGLGYYVGIDGISIWIWSANVTTCACATTRTPMKSRVGWPGSNATPARF